MQNTSNTAPRTGPGAFFWRNLPRLLLLCALAAIAVLMFTCKQKAAVLEAEKAAAIAEERKPINVVLLDLQPTTVEDKIDLPGMIEAWTDLSLMAKVRGTVSEVLVEEGDGVTKGQVLARIEEDDYRIALESATAAYNLAKVDYDRDQNMLQKKVKSQASLDVSHTKLQTARADMENARLQLERCTIKAPMDGVINRLDAKVGLLLSIGDPVAQMLAIDRVKAVVGIPESDVAAMQGVAEVELSIQALENKKILGRRHYLSKAPESAARLYRLELALDNPDLPGRMA
jgi:membrane fusion protein (multidrug efflux system)